MLSLCRWRWAFTSLTTNSLLCYAIALRNFVNSIAATFVLVVTKAKREILIKDKRSHNTSDRRCCLQLTTSVARESDANSRPNNSIPFQCLSYSRNLPLAYSKSWRILPTSNHVNCTTQLQVVSQQRSRANLQFNNLRTQVTSRMKATESADKVSISTCCVGCLVDNDYSVST